eukprot:365119-Chlamydomonas_euryale.AAC.4
MLPDYRAWCMQGGRHLLRGCGGGVALMLLCVPSQRTRFMVVCPDTQCTLNPQNLNPRVSTCMDEATNHVTHQHARFSPRPGHSQSNV